MKYDEMLAVVGDEPVFETGLLLAGDVDAADVQRQLSRWTRAGRLIQLRKGLYALAAPHRKGTPHPFLIANRLVRGSYVSLESALAHHGLIPEHVPVTTSVTTGRPGHFTTALGGWDYRHVAEAYFFGYDLVDLAGDQRAFVALPEKALLDLVHLRPGGDTPAFLRELRLQNLDRLDAGRLAALAARAQSPKLARAAARLTTLAAGEAEEYTAL